MTKFEVVFLSTPAIGNIVPIVEFANHLTKHNPQFSATILIITLPQRLLVNTYTQSLSSSTVNLKFIHLPPPVDPPTPDQYQSFIPYISLLIQNQKNNVKNTLLNLTSSSTESNTESVKLAAVFVDMFSTPIIDVAKEISVPCYLFFASPASFLGFMLHLPSPESLESETEFEIPSFKNPLPKPVLPSLVVDMKTGAYSWMAYHGERYRETKGIIVNTVQELEPHALQSLYNDLELPVYPIGPILDLDGPAQWDPNPVQYNYIMEWLDTQEPGSVVFLCFGSLGSLEVKQVEEIAIGLERAGVKFLWALREPPKARLDDPRDYASYENVLPDGFLKRTVGMGIVCGWVPQAKVLAHKAVGGFISHCGWNSLLESLWNGVVVAAWPVYAEQQMNAFEMVRELGLAVEIRLDYRKGGDLVRAEEVENGVRTLMDGCDEIKKKVKDMSEKCRVALMENGSSYSNLVSLVKELTNGQEKSF